MERSNEFNNQTMQTEKYTICINDETEINQVKEESENPSLQTKVSRVLGKSDEKEIKQILQQLQTQRKKWRPHNRNALCWFLYFVNDYSKVNLDVLQLIHCLLCHSQPFVSVNSRK
jgi:hypothetical protein